MDRLYGSWPCDLCRYPSPFDWLYCCTADIPEVGDFAFLKSLKHPVSPAGEAFRQAGLSESIIKQFEQGEYTHQQLQIILHQKQHLKQVIETSTSPLHPTDKESAQSTAGLSVERRCEFKVCQLCRPMYKERYWTSFHAVFEDEVRPLDDYEMKQGLPVKDASVAKHLGLRRPLPFVSAQEWPESPNDSENISPLSAYSSNSFSTDEDYDDENCGVVLSSNTHAADNSWSHNTPNMAFVTRRDSNRAHTPRSTIRLVPNSSVRRRLRRVAATIDDDSPSQSHTTRSSISLPTIPTTTSYTTLPEYVEDTRGLRTQYSHKAMTDPELYSDHHAEHTSVFGMASSMSSKSSLGSEILVEGGFALTEEAMYTHTPDIYTKV
jgi:hypothetical protein